MQLQRTQAEIIHTVISARIHGHTGIHAQAGTVNTARRKQADGRTSTNIRNISEFNNLHIKTKVLSAHGVLFTFVYLHKSIMFTETDGNYDHRHSECADCITIYSWCREIAAEYKYSFK